MPSSHDAYLLDRGLGPELVLSEMGCDWRHLCVGVTRAYRRRSGYLWSVSPARVPAPQPRVAPSDQASAAAPLGRPTAEDVGGLLRASVTAGCKNSWQEVRSLVWCILNVLLIQPTSEFCRIIQCMQKSYVTSYV